MAVIQLKPDTIKVFEFQYQDNIVKMFLPFADNKLIVEAFVNKPFTKMFSAGYLLVKEGVIDGKIYPIIFAYYPVISLPPFVGTSYPHGLILFSSYIEALQKYLVVISRGNSIVSLLQYIVSFLPRFHPIRNVKLPFSELDNTYAIFPAFAQMMYPYSVLSVQSFVEGFEYFNQGIQLNTRPLLYADVPSASKAVNGEFALRIVDNYWTVRYLREEVEAMSFEFAAEIEERIPLGKDVVTIGHFYRDVLAQRSTLFLFYKLFNEASLSIWAEIQKDEWESLLPGNMAEELLAALNQNLLMQSITKLKQEHVSMFYRQIINERIPLYLYTSIADWIVSSLKLPWDAYYSTVAGQIYSEQFPYVTHLDFDYHNPDKVIKSYVVEGFSFIDEMPEAFVGKKQQRLMMREKGGIQ